MGKRLLPFTEVLQKPLIPIKGKPVVDHIIDNFRLFGIKNFFLTLNFKSKILNLILKVKIIKKSR